jgi:hypothetical protein
VFPELVVVWQPVANRVSERIANGSNFDIISGKISVLAEIAMRRIL